MCFLLLKLLIKKSVSYMRQSKLSRKRKQSLGLCFQVTPVPPVLRVSRVCEANQVIPDLPGQPVHLVHAVSLVFLEKM